MNLKKTPGMVLAVVGLVAMVASEAAAQAPTLTGAVNGPVVSVSWTPVSQATGYLINVAGALSGQVAVPASTTSFTVTPPPGTYQVAVQATAGSIVGPFSNAVTLTVGGPSTPPPPGGPGAPTLTANTAGTILSLSWTPVAGTVGYRLEFSQSPGGPLVFSQLLPANQTTFTQAVPVFGTFYARVVAGNAAGQVTSNEVSFTINPAAPGSGPRTPDPPAGQRLPVPGYLDSVVQQVGNAFRGDLLNSCREHGGNNGWLFRLVSALRQLDSRWGLNWKRGNRGDMSQDVVNYHFGAGPDEDATNVYIFDVIVGHCGNPIPGVNDVTEATRQGGSIGRWTLQPYLAAGGQP